MPADRRPVLPALRRRRPAAAARFVAGPRIDDAVGVAAEVVAAGRRVDLQHVPGRSGDVAAELTALAGLVVAAGVAGSCELTVPVDRLGAPAAAGVAAAAAGAGPAICLSGPAAAVDALALPAARVAVRAGEPGAEDRCRWLAGRPVRLVQGRGPAADLAFVRCLDLLLADDGPVAVATTDPRLVAVAGERAAWYARPPESWEHVMPYGVRSDEQQRLVAAGVAVRVTVLSGAGAFGAVVRRVLAGRGIA